MPKIKISEAARLSKSLDLQAVVIIGVDQKGIVTVVSYGETKAKCKAIGDWAQGLWKYAISLSPFQTIFGWGNKGIPKKFANHQISMGGGGGFECEGCPDCI